MQAGVTWFWALVFAWDAVGLAACFWRVESAATREGIGMALDRAAERGERN